MKKHVLVKGGLGNQMFQYAFYLSLKQKGVDCVLDKSLFDMVSMHQGYELDKVFGILNSEGSETWINRNLVRLLYKYKPSGIVYADTPYQYKDDVYYSNCLLYTGCWIHPSYFSSIEDKIKEAFVFHNINEKNKRLAEDLATINSVSLHIRRGDYLNNPIYDVCDASFHKKAIQVITEKVDNPQFLVFSDDPDWCANYMKQFHVDYKMVDWNKGKDSFQDMYLMSKCKHNIIANSTFSWWGAWLNANPNKIVISPSKWTIDTDINYIIKNWKFITV